MVDLPTIKLPKGFLEEEERDGFLVTRKRKEIWAVEMDMLIKFISVCKKYNLRYFADSGTLLGAVRHKGFIPWDDDIDIAMLRKDYDIFCEIAKNEFEYPYFFQIEETDPGSARKHVQIRNSMTTAIIMDELKYKYKFNQGIFIDVFPLDNIPKASLRKEFFDEIKYLRNKSNEFTDEYTHKGVFIKNTEYEKFEKCITRYVDCDTLQIGNLALMGGKRTSNRYKRDYNDIVELDFEFLKINAPIGYKNELRRMFGNWKKYVVYNGVHSDILFDTEKPYTDYLNY